jgi:hypothetical protein
MCRQNSVILLIHTAVRILTTGALRVKVTCHWVGFGKGQNTSRVTGFVSLSGGTQKTAVPESSVSCWTIITVLSCGDATSQGDVSITLWKYTTSEAVRVTDMNSSHYFMHFHPSYTSHTYTVLSVIERIRTFAPSNVIYWQSILITTTDYQ